MKFEIDGYGIENLFSTLHQKKVKIFNLSKNSPNHASFETLDKDEKKVKRYIANFKVKQTLSKAKRLPKFLLANIGIVIGVFLGSIFGIFASNHTWQIIVYGTKELKPEEIISVLKSNGVSKGKINTQTSEEIEEILLNNYDRIAQVSVIREGTAIIINLSEKLVYNEKEFQPILAKNNGIIKEINVITGTVNVKIGDYVNVGDVLVLPFNINADGEKISVKPMAQIEAEMFVVGKCEIAKEETILARTGRTKRAYKYKIFKFDLFWGKHKNSFADFEFDVYNESISGLVPLTRDVYTYYELAPKQIVHDFEAEKQNLMEKSLNLARKEMPIGEIISENTSVSIVEDKMFAISTLVVLGNINDSN